jgi:nicotinamide-nucleotide amidase
MPEPAFPVDASASPSSVGAYVLTVGDELLAGDITDTNLVHFARRCRALGIELRHASTVRDRIDEIAAAVTSAAAGAQVCLISGGLGPTSDDLTAEAVALAAGVPLQRDDAAIARLEAKYRAFGRVMPEANRKQADFPRGADILDNPIGTAEGFCARVGECRVFVMPGVPREMKKMFAEQVEPRLQAAFTLQPVVRRTYRILGHGESTVAERIEPILAAARARSPRLAAVYVHYRASMPEVTVILEGLRGPAGGASMEELATLDAPIVEALQPGIYGIGQAELAARVVAALRDANLWLGAAESCTGGGLGAAITAVPGASACLRGVVVAYDNSIKEGLLGVPSQMLAEHGAVSEPVARALASGARTRLGSDLAVAITGIAGPSGGTPEKPVGTVHIAVSDESEISHLRLQLRGDRGSVQRAATRWALKLVWDRLVARGVASIQPLDA